MANKTKLDLSTNNLLTCFFYAIVGILLIILKSGALGILMTITGALLILIGLVIIFKDSDLVKGIILIAAGIAIIIFGWTIANIVLLVLGILLILKGIFDLIKNRKNGFSSILSAIIVIIIGALLVISNWKWVDVMCIIAGVIFIINAILTLFGKSVVKKRKK